MLFDVDCIEEKYRIDGLISEGTISYVFKGFDESKSQDVAIKVLKKMYVSDYMEDLIRFKTDMGIAFKMDHPNIARVFSVGEYNGAKYIIMEFLRGEPLSEFINHELTKVKGTGFVVEIIIQAAQALACLHDQKVTHRFIRPSSIFVYSDDKGLNIKVKDFGISSILDLGAASKENALDVFGYMAPEVSGILNRDHDIRSDLYSLGAVAYYMLTGVTPFKSGDINSIIHQQAAYTPLPVRHYNPVIPVELENIVMKLLNKDPELRYGCIAKLISDLKSIIEGTGGSSLYERDTGRNLSYRTDLVGRDSELEKLRELYLKTAEGSGGVCLVTGEAGAGKSRLIEELDPFIIKNNGMILKGSCINSKNKFPYRPFKEVLAEYINYLSERNHNEEERDISRLKSVAGKLGRIFVDFYPPVEKFFGQTQDLRELEPERENKRFLTVMSSLILSLGCKERPCVVFIDDIQWSDEGTICLLDEIGHFIKNSYVLVVISCRDVETDEQKHLEVIRKTLNPYILKLGPLDEQSAALLVTSILDINEEKIKELIKYILKKAKGNVYYIINLVRSMVENGVLLWDGSVWNFSRDNLGKLSISDSLADLIILRLKTLPKEYAEVMYRASVIGRYFDIEILSRTLGIGVKELDRLMDKFVSMQLVERKEDTKKLAFAHEKIRDAFYNKINRSEIPGIHASIGGAIEKVYGEDNLMVVFELANHYIEGSDEKAVKYSYIAAQRAKSIYALNESIFYYEYYIDTMRNAKQDMTRWIDANENLAEVYTMSGKTDKALEILHWILPLQQRYVINELQQVRILKKIGMAYYKKGDLQNAEKYYGLCLAYLGEKIPSGKLSAVFQMSGEIVYFMAKPLIKLRKTSTTGEEKQKKEELVHVLYSLCGMYALSNLTKFLPTALKAYNRAVVYLSGTNLMASIFSGFAISIMMLPNLKYALKYNKKALELRKRLKDKWGTAQSLMFTGLSYSWNSKHKKALKYFAAAKRGFKAVGDMWEYGMTLNFAGTSYVYVSEYRKAMENYNRHLSVARNTKDNFGILSALTGLSICHTEYGAFSTAEELLEEAIALSRQCNLTFSLCFALGCYGYLKLEEGLYEEALPYLEESKKLDEQNNFMKDYTVIIYSLVTEANIRIRTKNESKCKDNKELKEEKNNKYPPEEMRRLLSKALNKTKNWPNHYAAALRVAANFHQMCSNKRKAERYFKKGIEFSNRIGRGYEEGKACFEYALFLKSNNRYEEELIYLVKAYRVFSRINARKFIERCWEVLNNDKEYFENPLDIPGSFVSKERFRYERKLNTVLDTSSFLSSILDLRELLNKILESAAQLVGAERGLLMLYPDTGERILKVMSAMNMDEEEIISVRFKRNMDIIKKAEMEKAPILVSDKFIEGISVLSDHTMPAGLSSVICVPVISRNVMTGVIFLENSFVGGMFTNEDLRVIELISSQAGVSIENARLYEKSRETLKQLEQLNQTLEQKVGERTAELGIKNAQLEEMVEKLKEYAKTVEELAATRERNRLARDIHDTLGHTMTLVVNFLEIAGLTIDNDIDNTKLKITQAINASKAGLKELRRSIAGLSPQRMENTSLINSLRKMVIEFSAAGTRIEFSVDGEYNNAVEKFSDVLYRTCQESLTNSLRHGKAKNVNIILRFSSDNVSLFVFDDGTGCKSIKKGFGLKGMEDRVGAVNGKINYGTSGNNGFNVCVEIPFKSQDVINFDKSDNSR